jgi:hypothetical protein
LQSSRHHHGFRNDSPAGAPAHRLTGPMEEMKLVRAEIERFADYRRSSGTWGKWVASLGQRSIR